MKVQNILLKQKKNLCLMQNIFLMVIKQIQNMHFHVLKQLIDQGARWIVLCDTNGGTLPHEVSKIVSEVSRVVPGKNLGIHAHNDTGNAVANSLAGSIIWCSSNSRYY